MRRALNEEGLGKLAARDMHHVVKRCVGCKKVSIRARKNLCNKEDRLGKTKALGKQIPDRITTQRDHMLGVRKTKRNLKRQGKYAQGPGAEQLGRAARRREPIEKSSAQSDVGITQQIGNAIKPEPKRREGREKSTKKPTTNTKKCGKERRERAWRQPLETVKPQERNDSVEMIQPSRMLGKEGLRERTDRKKRGIPVHFAIGCRERLVATNIHLKWPYAGFT